MRKWKVQTVRVWIPGAGLLGLLLLLSGLLLPAVEGEVEGEQVTAFVGVNVLPMDRRSVLENYTVLVRGDRIITVGPAHEVEVPEGARRIDGRGKYLMPGLTEMHGHVPSSGSAQQEKGALAPEVRS